MRFHKDTIDLKECVSVRRQPDGSELMVFYHGPGDDPRMYGVVIRNNDYAGADEFGIIDCPEMQAVVTYVPVN